jgi:hypothetical protein
MKKISFAVIALLCLFAVSCRKTTGEGPVVTETRAVSGFADIDQRVGASVYYTQAPDYKVEVIAQRNILDVLQTYVSGNRLVVKFKDGVRVNSHEDIRVNVSAPRVSSLRISGSGNLYVTGPFTPASLEMDISGSGSMAISELTTALIDADISGSGSISISHGTATEEKLKISGSGSLNLEGVTADRATTNTSGSGTIKVTATQTLNVTISGSGNVFYKGSPQVNVSVSGSGKVIQL